MTYYGQRETDRIIAEYFPNQNTGFCIEVGAYDGLKGSNTKYFEDLGWDTWCIEPNPQAFAECQRNRSGKCFQYACDNENGASIMMIVKMKSGIESSLSALHLDQRLVDDYGFDIVETKSVPVKTARLDTLLDLSYTGGKDIDFVSIDTEGTELDVLKGLDMNRYKPALLVVENNYEDKVIREYMAWYGYKLDQRYFVNDFYVRN